MKKLICLMIALVTISFTQISFAQDSKVAPRKVATTKATPPSPEQRAERRAAHIKKQLMLSDEQYNQVREAALKIETTKNKDVKERNKNGEKFEAELKNILNPEQMEKYEAMKSQRKEQTKERIEQRRNEEKMKSEGSQEDKKDESKD